MSSEAPPIDNQLVIYNPPSWEVVMKEALELVPLGILMNNPFEWLLDLNHRLTKVYNIVRTLATQVGPDNRSNLNYI